MQQVILPYEKKYLNAADDFAEAQGGSQEFVPQEFGARAIGP
jgi:hypothetical protein